MGNICERAQNNEYNFNDFQFKNTYPKILTKSGKSFLHIKNTLDQQNSTDGKIDGLAQFISKSKYQQFKDQLFPFPDFNECKMRNISELYDFNHNKIQKVYREAITRLDFFDEKDLQLGYLVSVFFAICKNPRLKDQIFITKKINQYKAYIIRLFCNGAPTLVAIDQKIPTQNDNPKYLNLKTCYEIWPLLLEKAWCKQIGSYPKSRGLSPEDAYEEITGIPSYSFSLQGYSKGKFDDMIDKYWCVLISRKNSLLIQPRQIFYVERQRERKYSLRSPYANYEYKDHKKNTSDPILLDFQEILQKFQFITIGYETLNHITYTYEHQSSKRQQKLYELIIKDDCSINIRFIQFYKQYMGKKQAENYEYSPIFIELYDQSYRLIKQCQGCPKSLQGNRSINLSQNILTKFAKGRYYLRIEVDWLYEPVINKGNILVYGPPDGFTIQQAHQSIFEFRERIYQSIGNQREEGERNLTTHENEEQMLTLVSLEKQYGNLIRLYNNDDMRTEIEVNLSESKNIRFRNHDASSNIFRLKIEARESAYLQVVPENPKIPYHISPLKISKH